jgi:hypothetical protein
MFNKGVQKCLASVKVGDTIVGFDLFNGSIHKPFNGAVVVPSSHPIIGSNDMTFLFSRPGLFLDHYLLLKSGYKSFVRIDANWCKVLKIIKKKQSPENK